MLDCIEVICPKGGVKGTISSPNHQTTIILSIVIICSIVNISFREKEEANFCWVLWEHLLPVIWEQAINDWFYMKLYALGDSVLLLSSTLKFHLGGSYFICHPSCHPHVIPFLTPSHLIWRQGATILHCWFYPILIRFTTFNFGVMHQGGKVSFSEALVISNETIKHRRTKPHKYPLNPLIHLSARIGRS